MRIIQFTFTLLLAIFAVPLSVAAADGATVHAILITASKEKGPADPKLAPYEAPLQRNLPESSFRYSGEGSASVSGTGRGSISLSRGHRLEIEGEKGDGDVIRLKLQWMNGKTVILSGSFVLQRDVPIVLGRRPSGDGDFPVMIVIAK